MAKGWIMLSRKLQECFLWQEKPFSKGQAWVDMLLSASHEDKKFLLGGEVIECKRGSFITSELKLMDKWGWSKSKVRAFLTLLQNESMIEKYSDKKKTTINIVNYSVYQDVQTTKRPQKDHKRTTERPQKDTINNINNNNNINKEHKRFENEMLDAAFTSYVEHRKSLKSPMTDNAIKLAIAKLQKIGANDQERVEIINQSILNGWKGLFELKNQQQAKQSTNNKFNQFPQRDYDMNSLEQQLLNGR